MYGLTIRKINGAFVINQGQQAQSIQFQFEQKSCVVQLSVQSLKGSAGQQLADFRLRPPQAETRDAKSGASRGHFDKKFSLAKT